MGMGICPPSLTRPITVPTPTFFGGGGRISDTWPLVNFNFTDPQNNSKSLSLSLSLLVFVGLKIEKKSI